jgi:hypothetical protein
MNRARWLMMVSSCVVLACGGVTAPAGPGAGQFIMDSGTVGADSGRVVMDSGTVVADSGEISPKDGGSMFVESGTTATDGSDPCPPAFEMSLCGLACRQAGLQCDYDRSGGGNALICQLADAGPGGPLGDGGPGVWVCGI